MIEDIVGDNGSRFVIAVAAVAIGLLLLVVVLWFMRNRPSSPFVRGGKNRQPRLAVLDAAAIDTRRRLVLVRRDDVEHLIMIGGPTDIVVESRIVRQAPAGELPAEPEAIAARPAPERRTPVQPPEGRRVEARPQPVAPAQPVSAMGQVLYAEAGDTLPAPAKASPTPVARPQPAPVSRPTANDRPAVDPALLPRAAAPVQPSPAAPAVRVAATPEDILDAARHRVLPTEASSTPVQPQPVASQSAFPTPAAATVQNKDQAPAGGGKTAAADFERILDAEITGDLGRLTGGPAPAPAVDPRPAPVTLPRPEPRPPAPAVTRQEPSLEDEMNRMLNEIAVTRKN